MTAEQAAVLLQQMERLVFLCQTLCLASCFLCGFAAMQLIIHSKNQKTLL